MCARHHNAHQTQRLNHNFKWEVWCHPLIALICLLVITAFYHKCRSTCEEHGSLQRMKSRQLLENEQGHYFCQPGMNKLAQRTDKFLGRFGDCAEK
ncbi:hypothetical protein AVEN_161239-1 [Araneus ventricosus]|uniref:Uncharacterized protein n=1 Tax=Araneus ventricosus TaxID=182803 RepID=A0A4Y2T8X1_ARAVE|nr:hypothetical protein AVEN_49661-1 [Araneus ventricosus]GBN95536.1 hypothetical protein AVEN_161239-1 [Araneus ventricosus]